jgi:hypothetical protein
LGPLINRKKKVVFKTVVFVFLCASISGVALAQADRSASLDRPAGVQITNMSADDPRVTSAPLDHSDAQPLQADGELRTRDSGRSEAPRRSESVSQEAEPDIEFQDFVASSLGYRLPIFGHDLFRNAPSTFAPLDRVPVTPDYLIGPGDELLVRAWLHVEDHCRAILAVIEKGREGEVYNIGGDCERENIHVARTILKHLGRGEELIQFVQDRPGHDRRYAIDCEKIKAELGWQQRWNFETGLPATIEWYKKHADWVEQLQQQNRDYFKRHYEDRSVMLQGLSSAR